FLTLLTAATAPAERLSAASRFCLGVATITEASISTVPSVVRREPVPALNSGWSSRVMTAATTAFKAVPPRRRMAAPLRAAISMQRLRSGWSSASPRAPAPPWTIRAGAIARGILRAGTASPQEQPLEIEDHRSGGSICGFQPTAIRGQKLAMTMLRQSTYKGAQSGGSVPFHHVGRASHRMVKGMMVTVDLDETDFRQSVAVPLRLRDRAKRLVHALQHRGPRLFTPQPAQFYLRGFLIVGRHLNH